MWIWFFKRGTPLQRTRFDNRHGVKTIFPQWKGILDDMVYDLPAYRHKLGKYPLDENHLRYIWRKELPPSVRHKLVDGSMKITQTILTIFICLWAYKGCFRMGELTRVNKPRDSGIQHKYVGMLWSCFAPVIITSRLTLPGNENFVRILNNVNAPRGLYGWLNFHKTMHTSPKGQDPLNRFTLDLDEDDDDMSILWTITVLLNIPKSMLTTHTEFPFAKFHRPVFPDPNNLSFNIEWTVVSKIVKRLFAPVVPEPLRQCISTHSWRSGKARMMLLLYIPAIFIISKGRWNSIASLYTYLASDICSELAFGRLEQSKIHKDSVWTPYTRACVNMSSSLPTI